MDSLIGKLNARQVRAALENLPEGMDGTYDEAMERIERQDDRRKQLARRVLSWITYAVRPLSVKELQYALAVMPDTTKLDPDDIIDDEILTSVCAGLVVIDEERNVIGLVRKPPTVECRNTVNFYSLHRLHSTRLFRTQRRVSISKCSCQYRYDVPHISVIRCIWRGAMR
jgi:hypothetical protein